MTPRTLIASLALMGLLGSASAGTREGIFNGGFERGAHAHENRPAHWLIGFPDDPAPVQGEWRTAADGGSTALELITHAGEMSSVIVVQVVDLPAAEMAGETLSARCRVRRVSDEGWVGVQIAALNPEATPDPETGVSHVGWLQLTAAAEQGWQELSGDLTLLGPAEMIVVVLFAVGDGEEVRARFDDVSVITELDLPACGPWSAPPLAGGPPPFPVGVVNENPRNRSDRALEDLIARAAEVGDTINLFAHVRWNGLAGLPLLDGHDRVLEQGRRAAGLGLELMLTFDFTHAELDGIGHINPWPDGTPVERLDSAVRAGYVNELAALVEAVRPAIVSVGIETDFFLERHHGEWGDFRALLCEARERLQAGDPDLHVTTYFTLETLVHPDLSPNTEGQSAMRELMPCIDSVGFSYYPADGVHHLEQIPEGGRGGAGAPPDRARVRFQGRRRGLHRRRAGGVSSPGTGRARGPSSGCGGVVLALRPDLLRGGAVLPGRVPEHRADSPRRCAEALVHHARPHTPSGRSAAAPTPRPVVPTSSAHRRGSGGAIEAQRPGPSLSLSAVPAPDAAAAAEC